MATFLERMATAEAARVRAEIAEACRRRDRAQAAAALVRQELAALRALASAESGSAGAVAADQAADDVREEFALGTTVRIIGFAEKVDGHKAIIVGKVARRLFFFFKVKLETGECKGELWHVPADSVERLEQDLQTASERQTPDPVIEDFGDEVQLGIQPGPTLAAVLSPSGRRFRTCLSPTVGSVPCEVWPLVHSGVARVHLPDVLLSALRADMAAAAVNGRRRDCPRSASAPSVRPVADRSRQLRNEFRGGNWKVTMDCVNDGFLALLLEISNLLASALLGSNQFRCEVDGVWGVVQRSGDYCPHQKHRSSKSPFGFSSLVDVELPPQLTLENHGRCPKGSNGHHDGVHQLVWKADRSTDPDSLILPGILPCEFMTGYLYVFPQWISVSTFPFDGEGDRKWVTANIAVFDVEAEPESHGAAPPLMSTWVL